MSKRKAKRNMGHPDDAALGVQPQTVPQKKIEADKAFQKFGDLWISNFRANLTNLAAPGSYTVRDFEAQLTGKPVIICGAGESIYSEIDTLWDLRGEVKIVCLDHVWRWLPFDAVFSLDGQAKIHDLFFDGFERNAKGKALIASTHSQPQVCQSWLDRGGQVFWFHPEYGDGPPEAWKEKDRRCRELLPKGFATSFIRFNCFGQAIITATKAKATPIILVGIDLAWTKRYYADDALACYGNLSPERGFVSDCVYNKMADGSLEGPAWTTPTLQLNREILQEASENGGARIVAAGSGPTLLGPRKPLRETVIDLLPDVASKLGWK